MGEIILSLFVGAFIAAIGLFMNWYLAHERKKIESEEKPS